ncbi:MAG: aldehyde dehydrogenase family protein [Thermodesulfobacteriota bacterium]
MSFIEREASSVSDDEAIINLKETIALQKNEFIKNPFPSLDQRLELIGALANMMIQYRTKIHEALDADFHGHPTQFADLVECLGVAGRAGYVAENLAEWMKPQMRFAEPAVFGTGKAYIQYQPKGVIGNMVPWNFPFDVGLGPLVEMLAAGNRAIVKPSDLVPACGELTLEMVNATFDRDQVAVVIGGIELSKAFSTLQWDHLMYTGGIEVGRSVAVAAAQNLTPVTLELGGKNPALIADDNLIRSTVETVIGCKMIKNGQMCTSPDYVMVSEGKTREFSEIVKEIINEAMPEYTLNAHTTGIINGRHLNRLMEYVDDAKSKGATIVEIGGKPDRKTLKMPFTLVLNPTEDMKIMQNEIFGPILPVKTYKTIDEAVGYINSHERPLGVYFYTQDATLGEKVKHSTVSGGFCLNVAAAHSALPSLGFGGIGSSGIGRHHGIEGFLEFSNPRGVFERGEDDLIASFFPPYGDLANAVIAGALGEGDA